MSLFVGGRPRIFLKDYPDFGQQFENETSREWKQRTLLSASKIQHNFVYFRIKSKALDSVFISNFRLIVNVVFFLLVDAPESEFYVPTFRNTLSVPSS